MAASGKKNEGSAGGDAGEGFNDMNMMMQTFFQMMKPTVTAATTTNESVGGQQMMNESMFASMEESGGAEVPMSATVKDVTMLYGKMEIHKLPSMSTEYLRTGACPTKLMEWMRQLFGALSATNVIKVIEATNEQLERIYEKAGKSVSLWLQGSSVKVWTAIRRDCDARIGSRIAYIHKVPRGEHPGLPYH